MFNFIKEGCVILARQKFNIREGEKWAEDTRAKINDDLTYNDPAFYGAVTHNPDDKGTSHVSIIDPKGRGRRGYINH